MTEPISTPLRLTQNRPAKVLIIDDEPDVLSVLNSLLSTAHHYRTATSAILLLPFIS